MTENMSEMLPLHGACLCGDVAFTAQQTHPASACHCGMCRKHHSAPFHAVACEDFVVTKGGENLSVYQSSEWAQRGFCNRCGTGIFYRTQDESFMGLSLGCLHDPKPKLSQHIYVDCADVRDDHTPDIWDDLPQYTAKEFLDQMALGHLYDHHTPAIAEISACEHHGGCLCGGVRYHTTGALDDVLVCHCGQCNIQASSFYRATNVTNDTLHFDSDETLAWYAASTTAERGFCNRCGSKLFWRGKSLHRKESNPATLTSILVGTFDERLPLPFKAHIYQDHASGAYPLP